MGFHKSETKYAEKTLSVIFNKMVIEFLYANIRIQEKCSNTDLKKQKQKFQCLFQLRGIELYLNK